MVFGGIFSRVTVGFFSCSIRKMKVVYIGCVLREWFGYLFIIREKITGISCWVVWTRVRRIKSVRVVGPPDIVGFRCGMEIGVPSTRRNYSSDISSTICFLTKSNFGHFGSKQFLLMQVVFTTCWCIFMYVMSLLITERSYWCELSILLIKPYLCVWTSYFHWCKEIIIYSWYGFLLLLGFYKKYYWCKTFVQKYLLIQMELIPINVYCD